jgi:uncharacterized protein
VNRDQMRAEIRDRLKAAHGARLRGAVLYGSEARGDARSDSDIDLLVLLDGPVDYGKDLETNLDALYPLSVMIGRRISPKPVNIEQYNSVDCPLYRAAHQEGVPL